MEPGKQKYLDYIGKELKLLAELKYPNDPNLQRIYIMGFSRAQLMEACYSDTKIFANFKAAVEAARKKPT